MARISRWFLFVLGFGMWCSSSPAEWDVTTVNGIYRYDDSGNFLGLLTLNQYSGITVGPQGIFANYTGSSNYRVDLISGGSTTSFGTTAGMFSPEALTLGPDGTLYDAAISSTSLTNGKVARFNASTGAYLGDFVAAGAGGLQRPGGMAFGPDGNLYVDDVNLGTVLRYNGSTGAFMGTFSSGLTMSFAAGMTFGPDHNLYVADTNGSRVAEFNGTTGALIKTITTSSVTPADVAFDSSGTLYVTDIGPGARIMRYNAQTGASLGRFDSTSVGTNSPLSNPDYIAYVVPEPSALAVFGCGGFLLFAIRRQRSPAVA